MPTVRMRYTGTVPTIVETVGPVTPGSIVEVPARVANYFTIRGIGELLPDTPPVTHRDPSPEFQSPPKRIKR